MYEGPVFGAQAEGWVNEGLLQNLCKLDRGGAVYRVRHGNPYASCARCAGSCIQTYPLAFGLCNPGCSSHGKYLFALSPLTSSSSSSSSGLSLLSSSSSGSGAPFVPHKRFGHAPSLAWVEEAGWQFTPGAYRIAPNYFNDVNPNTYYPTEPIKDFAVAAPFTQRGSVYEISVQVKLS